MFSILRQAGSSRLEERVAAQYAMMADVPIASVAFDALDDHAAELRRGSTLPVGSVEFVRKGMALAGIAEPENLSYPQGLEPWLHRQVLRRPAGSVRGRCFVKPTTTKAFSGFVRDTAASLEGLTEHDRAQYDTFEKLDPDTLIWVSAPVTWLSEVRYYVVDGAVLGEGRYDDGPDEMPLPDTEVVKAMVRAVALGPGAPAAFGLDVGVLESGQTALIECNDAWALGYYRGTLGHRDYIEMLWRRWAQLAGA
ncbi:ATP-grasp domain-containing protein [Paraburkholderia youngii]|uniref:ATP-grasp domain-containing protein n=1 Tax=Paraburkholderia youngii TaxID=2782701 RepID=UPI003D24B9F5